MADRPRCICGVYIDCHYRVKDHTPRKASRLRLWFRDHSVWQHVAAPIWTRLPEKWRWAVVDRLNQSQRRCWGDLVSDALTYREADACDTHVPNLRPASAPRCATTCDWLHPEHSGEHDCSCYCGKFRFVADEGPADRKVADR